MLWPSIPSTTDLAHGLEGVGPRARVLHPKLSTSTEPGRGGPLLTACAPPRGCHCASASSESPGAQGALRAASTQSPPLRLPRHMAPPPPPCGSSIPARVTARPCAAAGGAGSPYYQGGDEARGALFANARRGAGGGTGRPSVRSAAEIRAAYGRPA